MEIRFLKDNVAFLRYLFRESHRTRKYIKYDEENGTKTLLINDIFFLIQASIDSIIALQKRDNGSVIPVIARTVFENMVNLAVIVSEDQEKGANRFLEFGKVSDYKMFQQYRKIDPFIAEELFTKEELSEAQQAHDNFKSRNLSTRDWFGKNLFELCCYVDQHHLKVIHIKKYFELTYLQTYPFLSKSVHGMATHLENVSIAKPKWPFNKFIFWDQSKDHEVTYLYHTIIAYLASLSYYNYYMGDEKEYLRFHDMLIKKFGIIVNSLKLRDKALADAGIKKKRRPLF